MRRWFTALMVPALAVCGSRSQAPHGDPGTVVLAAPDRTTREATAQVEAAAPDATSRGRVRLSDPEARLEPTGPGASKDYPELGQPVAVVDLARGSVEVTSYGGTALRGVSTFRYEVTVDVDLAVRRAPEARRGALSRFSGRLGARAFYADVWLDAQGRLRRVQVPVEKTAQRPGSRDRRTPKLVSVDFFDFRA